MNRIHPSTPRETGSVGRRRLLRALGGLGAVGLAGGASARRPPTDADSAAEPRTQLTGSGSAPFGVNVGGGESVTVNGLTFGTLPDPAVRVVGDATASGTDDPIAGTDDDALYQSILYGVDTGYEIDIENGTYDVTLHFVENYWRVGQVGDKTVETAEGKRVFDVSIQGTRVIEALDVYAAVGHDAALTRTVEGVAVTDGTLSIGTDTVANNSTLSGIEVRATGGDDDRSPVVGDESPTDPDGDGRYEDVNGDGEVTYADAVDLFENFDSPAVQDDPDSFDFNDNGGLDYDDVITLFESI